MFLREMLCDKVDIRGSVLYTEDTFSLSLPSFCLLKLEVWKKNVLLGRGVEYLFVSFTLKKWSGILLILKEFKPHDLRPKLKITFW